MLRRTGLVVAAELLPDVLRFTGHHAVGQRFVSLRTERRVTAPGHHVIAEVAVVGEHFLLSWELNAHAADADDVGNRPERYGFDVLVDDLDFPFRRRERGDGGEPERRIDRSLSRQYGIDSPLKAPETLRETGIDQQKLHW